MRFFQWSYPVIPDGCDSECRRIKVVVLAAVMTILGRLLTKDFLTAEQEVGP